MRIVLALILIALTALPLAAQEDNADRGVLEAFLEDRLSDAGREVNIVGFKGALSAQATLEELTIADADGIWLTLKGVVLDWSRAALLRGRVEVQELSAEEIVLERLPAGQGGPDVEDSEAQPFRLPDLPVSIDIGRVATDRLELGESVLGQAAILTVEAALSLADGAGKADIAATRQDAEGRFAVQASYANDTRDLALDVTLSEGPEGLVSQAIGLPGGPPVDLTLKGAGPLSDFAADLALATDGQDRVTGRLTLIEPEDAPGTGRFGLDISGDVEPLVAERVRPFFGDRTRVQVQGTRRADGGTDIAALDISTEALSVTGSLALAPTGLPERLALDGRLDGPVTLPLNGPETRVDGITLNARFDAARGETWQADIALDRLVRPDLTVGRARIAGTGTIRPEAPAALTADLDFSASGLTHADPVLSRTIGDAVTGSARIADTQGTPLELRDFRITAGNARVTAQGTLGDVTEGLPFDGRAELALDDLARLAPLAGRALGGAARARVSGRYGLLDGVFDLTLDAETRDLATGTPRLDPLLAGQGTLSLAAARGPSGTALRALDVETPALALTAGGNLSAAAGGLTLSGRVRDLSLLDGRLSGPGTVEAEAAWEEGGRLRLDRLRATGAGAELAATGALTPDDPTLPAEGRVTLSAPSLAPFSGLAGRRLAGALDIELAGEGALLGDLSARIEATGQDVALGIAQVDRLLGGTSRITGLGARTGGALSVEALDVATPVLKLAVSGDGAAEGALDLSGRLADLALVAPGFPGPLTLSGRALPRNGDWRLDLDATGPGGTTAAVSGTLARDGGRADLSLTGAAPLALANSFISPRSLDGQARFDLRLAGPLGLSALSGTVTTSGARLALPTLGQAITDLGGRVDLNGGRARLDLGGALDGGRVTVSGPVTLSAPFEADLAIALIRARLSDPGLYETLADGALTVTGPLTGGARIGGRIDLGRTEVQVPSGGMGASGAIPDITHRGAPAAVEATRARAGLTGGNGGGGGGRPYPLDLVISAPSQIFVRGRGLDAELGGQLRIAGTTADVVPEGQFQLIRGRLDILTKRFTLTEGRITLQGAFDPYLRFVAETRAADITAQVIIEGRATAPDIRFASQPELPEEEVLARILFGRGVQNLSAFQAVELASAVATLAGKGGGGILSRLREGTGLDDLDVTQTDDGGTQVRAGKYLSENLYSEVTVNEEGKSEINLNLDLTPNVTVKGSVGAEGDTGIGIFYERDY